ncbi:MAG: hypothetical protein JWP91_1424 [Fibrobacteres bacterium]|nr:hypothetical protein [Fibrobacterota bacterium]
MSKPKVEVGRWTDREKDPRQSPGANTPVGKLEALAWVLDSSIPVPGTNFRVGVESLIGLVPVIGDLIGAALSTYIIVMAARLGAPRLTLLRMGFNVTLEAVVGLVPIVGNLFDFAWKANVRNVNLLRDHIADPGRRRKGDWLFALGFLLFAAALFVGLGWFGVAAGRFILGAFGA